MIARPRRGALAKAALTLAVAALSIHCDRERLAAGESRIQNVVIVTLDTTRADRIGAFGGTAVPTPHLDRAAGAGTRFRNAISPVPLTLPAHASIFTGLYPFRHGVRHNGAYRLPPPALTLAERLHEAGFRTGAFVGAFVLDGSFGLDQGFDTYAGVAHSGASTDFLRPSELQRPAAAVNDAAIRWIESGAGKPFFAWIHYYDPHHPYAPPEDPAVKLDGTGYDREISYVDHCFGRLTAFLEQKGLLDQTLLVVAGDHGESLGSHGEQTHGIFLYEPCVRVPFFLRAPGLVRAGESHDAPVSLVDVTPTVLALLGKPPLTDPDGKSLFDASGRLAGEDPQRLVYAETKMPRIELGWSELLMVRDARFKFVRAPRSELYDLSADPSEARNLLDADPGRAQDYIEGLDLILAAGQAGEPADATNQLSPEELAKLQSLGYLQASAGPGADRASDTLPDPKDRIAEAVDLDRADELLDAGELEAAIAKYDAVLRANPGNHTALQRRARALLRSGDLDQALDACMKALAAAGSDADIPAALADNTRALLATVLSLLGRRAEAERALRSTSSDGTAQPKQSPASLLMAAAKNQDDAQAIVALAKQRLPKDPWTWTAALELSRRLGDAAGVEEARRALRSLGPASAAALVDAGGRAQASGELPLAKTLFETALAVQPDHPDVLGYLGTVELAGGDLAAAERAFQSIRRIRPQDPRAPMYLADIALLRNDEAKAREYIEESLRKAPQFVPPLLSYARWLVEKGRTAEAIRVAESALAIRPGDPDAVALVQQLRGGPKTEGG